MRRYGRVVAFLFAFGSVSAVPGAIIVEADPLIYLTLTLGVVAGAVSWFVPWERFSRRVFFIPTVLGLAETAAGVGLADADAAFYFLYVAVLAAYVFETRTELAMAIALIVAALFVPLLYEETHEHTIDHAVFAIPAVLITAGMVRYLSESLQSQQREFRRFAAETMTIAERIRPRRPRRGHGSEE